MHELRIIRYKEKYNVYEGDKVILSAVRTDSFFHSTIGFLDVRQSAPFALYTEKRRLFAGKTKAILLYTEKKKLNIEGKGEQCSLQIGNLSYSLYNKLSGGSGFYIDNKQAGRHETLRADSAGYEKRLIFTEEGFDHKIFICLLISMDQSI